MISMGAYDGITYINHHSPVSGPVAFIVSFPLALLNSVFCIWIYREFKGSLKLLKQKGQAFKLKIMHRLYCSVCVCILLSILLYCVDFFMMVSDERDKHWKSEWIRETSWLWIFTGFIITVIIILKPNEKSD